MLKITGGLRDRGILAWLIALAMMVFYALLYWDQSIDKWLLSKSPQLAPLNQQIEQMNNSPLYSRRNEARAAGDPAKVKELDAEIQALQERKDALYRQRDLIQKSVPLPEGRFATTKGKGGGPVELSPENKERVRQLRERFTVSSLLARLSRPLDGLSVALRGKDAQGNPRKASKWFLYATVYTLLIVGYGLPYIYRWRKNRYQVVRTVSVIFFQLFFAFLIPYLMEANWHKDFYFHYFWPLKFEYLWPDTLESLRANLHITIVMWTIFISFIGVPLLTWYFGKRWYCSWVCGCGALANTYGDSWRHLSDKRESAWRLEKKLIYPILAFSVLATVLIVVNQIRGKYDAFGNFALGVQNLYTFAITSAFAGLVGTGFYPLLGTRVWCRFGCPQAAFLGILQKYFSRFRITVNGDQCMSCGNCSTYCEMGIDVRSYAMAGQSFARASCVGCGLCQDVCPRGVLKLENGKDRTGVRAEF